MTWDTRSARTWSFPVRTSKMSRRWSAITTLPWLIDIHILPTGTRRSDRMNLLNTIGMECAIMKWGTNRVQKAEKKKKSEFSRPVNSLFSLTKIGRGERIWTSDPLNPIPITSPFITYRWYKIYYFKKREGKQLNLLILTQISWPTIFYITPLDSLAFPEVV